MHNIIPQLEEIALSLAQEKTASFIRTHKTQWTIFAIAVFFLGTSGFFLILALDKYLENFYASDIAALITAGSALAAALLALLIRHILQSRKKTIPRLSPRPSRDNISVLIQDVCQELEDPIRENPKTAVTLAALAGLFMTNERLRF